MNNKNEVFKLKKKAWNWEIFCKVSALNSKKEKKKKRKKENNLFKNIFFILKKAF